METNKKVTLADLKPVSDTGFDAPAPGFKAIGLKCEPCTGVAKTGKPYYTLRFTISRGENALTYSLFLKDNDVGSLKLLGVKFPELPAPVQVTGATVITA